MTNTDTQFTGRFAGLDAGAFVANQSTLADFVPTASPLNVGMMSDIGKATIYGPDTQPNFYGKFMKSPLTRGDSAMTARFAEVKSRVYNPQAPDSDLFNGEQPAMLANVAKKNLSRQIAVEVNDHMIKQFCQTDEMIGDAMAAIMATSNTCYMDDMWVACKEYFSGSMRSAKPTQIHTMTAGIDDPTFGVELNELLWKISQKDFGYKSAQFNASGANTRSNDVTIAIVKDAEYPAFNKLLSETFNPEMLRISVNGGIDYVDDFATPAGKPGATGDLVAMVVDTRAFEIVPMPDALTVESFRNPVRKSMAWFMTYEYAMMHNPFFNCAYIFAPAA